ncbi:cadherin-related family member 5-like [Leucoraja erinacea]|uniref:cadherin-related family member 5-like n=1 Tax=Leucoraja erinaceus TaxID=7782 RepID=UPI002454C0F3|nr:cadherin-related family member 5-like [Leucoraja erinacea]
MRALDYEVKRSLTLVLDAKEAANSLQVSDSVNITVRVLDEDNRPPLFEPCAGSVGPGLCLNAAYTGAIRQNTIEPGPLTLAPRNILAVDGDSGINATVLYRIINGDDGRAFQIDERDGALTMTKAITSLGPITLTILAYQENDLYKSTTTTVTLTVSPFSNHLPVFQKPVYYGTIHRNSPPGSIVMERDSSTRPLVVLAQDRDYPNMNNPALTYYLSLGDFTISRDGMIFTRSHLPPAQHEHVLTVTAKDGENGEVAQTEVRVLTSDTDVPSTVTASSGGAVATTAPGTRPSTGTAPVIPTRTPTPSQDTPTDHPAHRTTPPHTGSPGTGTSLTESPGSGATAPATQTRTPAPPGQPSPSQTTPGTPGTASELPPGPRPTPTDPSTRRTTPPHTGSPGTGTSFTGSPGSGATAPATAPTKPTRPPEPPGHSTQAPLPDISSTLPGTGATGGPGATWRLYDAGDMAAVGAPLSVLLLICLVLIATLLLQGGRWRALKLRATNALKASSRSPRPPGAEAARLQFTNPGFLQAATPDPAPSVGQPAAAIPPVGSASEPAAGDGPAALEEPEQEAGSEDNEVRSILTKERRHEDGYKAVWFQEDIQPEAHDQRVIEDEDGTEQDGDVEPDSSVL